jgi:hypothetical protein
MSRLIIRFAVLSLVALPLIAQGKSKDELRAELDRAQRELQDRQAEADALIDARMRYDLGVAAGPAVTLPGGDIAAAATTAPALERAQLQLAQEEAVTANLLGRFQRMRAEADRRGAEIAAQKRSGSPDGEWIVVPLAGSQGSRDASTHAQQPSAQQPTEHAMPHARPDGETAAQATPPSVRIAPNLQPIRAQIDGSDDHGLVATSLLKASQSLVDRADQLRSEGFREAADEALDEAKARLSRAVEELQRDAKNKDSFPHLFHLGRSRELLFRIAERREGLNAKDQPKDYQRREQEVRDAYVAITARDSVRKDGKDELGPWGRAAQSAMEHFRWMNLHSGYRPKTDLEAITWPGQKQ